MKRNKGREIRIIVKHRHASMFELTPDIYNKCNPTTEKTEVERKNRKSLHLKQDPLYNSRVLHTCRPVSQSAEDLIDGSVCSESRKTLNVHTFKTVTVLTGLVLETRETLIYAKVEQ